MYTGAHIWLLYQPNIPSGESGSLQHIHYPYPKFITYFLYLVGESDFLDVKASDLLWFYYGTFKIVVLHHYMLHSDSAITCVFLLLYYRHGWLIDYLPSKVMFFPVSDTKRGENGHSKLLWYRHFSQWLLSVCLVARLCLKGQCHEIFDTFY